MSFLSMLFGKKEIETVDELLERITTMDKTTNSYFTDKELACPCCKEVHMQGQFLDMLNAAREIAGKPWKVSSAYRCAKHNKEVGGVAGSAHTKGWAVDIMAPTAAKKYEIIQAALAAGINRIGVGAGFVHLDADPSKAKNCVWTY